MTASSLRLYARLQSAAHALKKTADRALMDAAGVTTAQAAVLAVVAGAERPTQKTVADALGLNESAVTGMANRLIALDYLAREKDPDDRRAWLLRLTTQGEKALERIAEPFGRINARLDDALGADIDAFAASLNRIRDAFERG